LESATTLQRLGLEKGPMSPPATGALFLARYLVVIPSGQDRFIATITSRKPRRDIYFWIFIVADTGTERVSVRKYDFPYLQNAK